MQKLEQLYVGRNGREWYESQLLHLVNQLPGMLGGSGDNGGGGVRDIGGLVETTPQSGVTGASAACDLGGGSLMQTTTRQSGVTGACASCSDFS